MKLASFFKLPHIAPGPSNRMRNDAAAAPSQRSDLPAVVAASAPHAAALESACKHRASMAGDTFFKAMDNAAAITLPQDRAMLQQQLQCGLESAMKAICDAALCRQSAEMLRMGFEQHGAARGLQRPRKAGHQDAAQARLLEVTSHAIADLNSIAGTWRMLPPAQRDGLADARFHVESLAKGLALQALALVSPQASNPLPNDIGGMSNEQLRSCLRESVEGLRPEARGVVFAISTSLAELLGDMSIRCAPVDEMGFRPGTYYLPTGDTEAAGRWADDAMSTFVKDVMRDTISGGVLTINGRDVLSAGTRERAAILREASKAAAHTPARDAAAAAHLRACQRAADEAVAAFTAAIPAQLRDLVLGICSQRAMIAVNGDFVKNFPGVSNGLIDGAESSGGNFAVEIHDADGTSPVVKIDAWRDIHYKGVVSALEPVQFSTPQKVRLQASYTVTNVGVETTMASARVPAPISRD
jgi:hypothetical protein